MLYWKKCLDLWRNLFSVCIKKNVYFNCPSLNKPSLLLYYFSFPVGKQFLQKVFSRYLSLLWEFKQTLNDSLLYFIFSTIADLKYKLQYDTLYTIMLLSLFKFLEKRKRERTVQGWEIEINCWKVIVLSILKTQLDLDWYLWKFTN